VRRDRDGWTIYGELTGEGERGENCAQGRNDKVHRQGSSGRKPAVQ